jgi:hypothetical protein
MKALGLYATPTTTRLVLAAGMAVIGVGAALNALQAGQPPGPVTPGPNEPNAEELVSRLSSPSFQEREAAGKALRALGAKAVPALNAGLSGQSPEGVQRCKRVLADIRTDELDRFVKAFEADKDRKAKFDHPVWLRWAKVVGDDRNSRDLLAEVLGATGAAETLDQLEADPKSVATLYPAELGRLHSIAVPRSF